MSGLELFVSPFRRSVVLGECYHLKCIEGVQWRPNILLCIAHTSASTRGEREREREREGEGEGGRV